MQAQFEYRGSSNLTNLHSLCRLQNSRSGPSIMPSRCDIIIGKMPIQRLLISTESSRPNFLRPLGKISRSYVNLLYMTYAKKEQSAKVSLDHWRALASIVDEGGYASAAEAMGKSQSTVSHSIQRIEELLGTRVLKVQGRKAVLTEVGKVVLRRARFLLAEAANIERVAHTLAAGVEAEVHLAVDTIFPNQVLLPAFKAFTEEFAETRIELFETVISGVSDMLVKGEVQLAITPTVPQGWLGNRLIELEMRCVAHPDHPLHKMGRPLNERDLSQHRQVVVRESSERRDQSAGWLGSEQRLTVSTMGTRIQALCRGLGFAWSPVIKITRELEAGLLKPLPLEKGSTRFVVLYLVMADEQGAGPATRAMARHIETQVATACKAMESSTSPDNNSW